MRYLVVIEKAGSGYSGYVPDLPGCVATGATAAMVKAELQSAIPFHLEGMQASGALVDQPQSLGEWVEV